MTNIASGNAIAEIAALIGDTARANILSELMGGQALTAGELARGKRQRPNYQRAFGEASGCWVDHSGEAAGPPPLFSHYVP